MPHPHHLSPLSAFSEHESASNLPHDHHSQYTHDDYDHDHNNYQDNYAQKQQHSGKPTENFKVSIRVRPRLPRERNSPSVIRYDNNTLVLSENYAANYDASVRDSMKSVSEMGTNLYPMHKFTFDKVMGEETTQEECYQAAAHDSVLSFLKGYNATILAFGCTSTGKTFTMEGGKEPQQRGVIPRATEEIFNYIQTQGNSKTKFLVRASYLQIYNEVISDLLKPERSNLQIREDKKKGIYVEGLSEWVVRNPAEVHGLLERGAQVRASAATRLNQLSSRSHAVFIIICEQSETTIVNENGEEIDIDTYKRLTQVHGQKMKGELRQKFKIGKLNLVDLAGSENIKFSGAKGLRLRETQSILTSLSALGQVIRALTDPKQSAASQKHIPYRNSKLTRLLTDSLGGNCKTHLISTVSPCLEIMHETLSTLRFANRAKNIQNHAQVNEDLDHRALLRKYEKELKRLRAQLSKKSNEHSTEGSPVDSKHVEELQEYARRAEEDKMAAVAALEKRSREFVQEKQAKRELEKKIALMQSQLLIGGEKIEETPVFRQLLKKEYERVHRVYSDKLNELERERQSIEEDKAQVDRYKHLLLKQRDIMIALTGRLNERDEIILQLQEELDAYDAHQRMLEETLDQKTAALLQTQKELRELQESKGLLKTGAQEELLQQQVKERDWYIERLKKQVETLKQRQASNDENKSQVDVLMNGSNTMDTKEVIKLRESNAKLMADLRHTEEENEKLRLNMQLLNSDSTTTSEQHNSGTVNQKDVEYLTQQLSIWKHSCENKEEEKQALKTIMEKKMLPAISEIYQSISRLHQYPPSDQEQITKETLSKLVVPLHKLVSASVNALKPSVSQQQSPQPQQTNRTAE
mmetsp:Transcript_4805/g.17979  ORF Transcript_4805/g.17979 Transcript_4805/m.17979 type:complete len:867 (-) Transcript_4805:1097-3697(-)|eukprot:CAMPEP_0117445506 /NCGR_PEP_ID=MMETSP0759-20121206/5833_1 /TAXON_ID=63605 /ORGANISM="Percolomonas cosmopolitus, Strain WS" /LENGTH=866 /DNA_ID=CAMNT_0005237689 /DNA_START=391 /DNA_END=2991 /DNA_ORIENTATION=+